MNKTTKKTLLIVEDNPADRTQILRVLEDVTHDFTEIITLQSFSQAKDYLSSHKPACCLLDCNLFDGTATQLLEETDTQENITVCPIIIITGMEHTQNAVELMKKGVMDYLNKPILEGRELIRVINSAEKTWQLQNKLNYLALHDSLTGLINRNLFVDRLTQLFNEYERTEQPFSLIYIDLDKFKLVNDQYGHEAGDFLLQEFANALSSSLRKCDTAARLGGDEFGILLPNTCRDECLNVADKLMNELGLNLTWHDHAFLIKLSMGVACYPGGAKNYQELMREADFALYQSKKNGRGQVSLFDQDMQNSVLASRAISQAIKSTIDSNGLKIVYQPIFDSKTMEVVEVEALIRWYFDGNWISPEKIITTMIEQKLSEAFHRTLFDNTLQQLKQWKRDKPDLMLSLNLPANLPRGNSILAMLTKVIESNGLDFKDLIIEITESQFMKHPEETRLQLLELEASKAGISIDDFGTGYSSMQYLANLPCHQLKIDKSFFLNLGNKKNEKIIKAIASLALTLELDIVAEGIESELITDKAKEFGCQKLQGFWLGAPVEAHGDFFEFLKRSKQEGMKLLQSPLPL